LLDVSLKRFYEKEFVEVLKGTDKHSARHLGANEWRYCPIFVTGQAGFAPGEGTRVRAISKAHRHWVSGNEKMLIAW